MKIFLASFLQPQNFGPGRIIGIVNGARPKDVKVDVVFEPLTPPVELINTYNELRPKDGKAAGEMFVSKYTEQLEGFYESVRQAAAEAGEDITNLLPFQDGDTLASWERAEYTNYRKLLAPFLEKMGYQVVLN